MKKKILGCVLAMATMFALTACGAEKTPTVEDIRENLGSESIMSYDINMELGSEITAEIVNPSELTMVLLEQTEDMIGESLLGEKNIQVSLEVSSTSERNEDYAYSVAAMEMDAESNINIIEEVFEERKFESREAEVYYDIDEEVKYTSEDGGRNWYYEDYELNPQFDKDELVETLLDIIIAHNEDADEDEQIEVEVDGDEYTLVYEFVLDIDYLESIGKSEKKAINSLLDTMDMGIDFDDIFELVDAYGEYAELDIPITVSVSFINNGNAKNPEYLLSGLSVSLDGNAELDMDNDEVIDILESMGAPSEYQLDFGVEIEFEISIDFSISMGYEEEDVEIPDDVIDGAEEAEWN